MSHQIIPIPCLKDNYAYLLICTQTGRAGLVDPSEAEPVLAAVERYGVEPVAILNTHHHLDHTGGNEALKQRFPRLQVYGHASDRGRIAQQNVFLEDGDKVWVGELEGRVLHNPGHTRGAISYVFGDAVFTGDTLFGGGCGRTFEGTAAEMHHSLNVVLGGLDPATAVYFGHEYTLNNLRFAAEIEPENGALQERIAQVSELRAQGRPSTPSRLDSEKATNPFLRCEAPEVVAAVRQVEPGLAETPAEVFRVLRAWKDRF
ncbi:MAG: hydroxyacylglutathione hydrolase [Candidatus Sericytochromatia bacterium]